MRRKMSRMSEVKRAMEVSKSKPITQGRRLSLTDLAKVTGGVPVPSGGSGDSGPSTTK